MYKPVQIIENRENETKQKRKIENEQENSRRHKTCSYVHFLTNLLFIQRYHWFKNKYSYV